MPGPELTELAEAAATRVASELGPDKATSVDQRFDHNPPEQLEDQSAGGTSTQGKGSHAREGAASTQLDNSNREPPASSTQSQHWSAIQNAVELRQEHPELRHNAPPPRGLRLAVTKGPSNGNSGNRQQPMGTKEGPTTQPKGQGGHKTRWWGVGGSEASKVGRTQDHHRGEASSVPSWCQDLRRALDASASIACPSASAGAPMGCRDPSMRPHLTTGACRDMALDGPRGRGLGISGPRTPRACQAEAAVSAKTPLCQQGPTSPLRTSVA